MPTGLWVATDLRLIMLTAAVFSVAAGQQRTVVIARPDSVASAVNAGRYDDAERLGSLDIAEADHDFGSDSLEWARAADSWVRARLTNGRAALPDTLDAAARAVRIKERERLSGSNEIAASLENLANVFAARGEANAGLPLHERAVDIRRRQADTSRTALADSLDSQASTLILLQRFREAERALEESQQTRQSGRDSPEALARTLYLVALLHRNDGQYAAATSALEQVLVIRRRALTSSHPELRQALQLLGQLQFLRGDIAGAKSIWQSSLEMAERTLRPEHPDIAEILRYLALASRALGDLQPARQLLDRALPIAEASLAPCNPELSALWVDTAGTMQIQGEYISARKLYESALVTRERCLGTNDQRTATVVYNLALLASKMRELTQAERLFQRAIRMWTLGLGANHPYVARGLDALAQIVAEKGDRSGARALYERALLVRQRSLGAEHPDVAWTMTNIARLAGASGQNAVALERVNQAVGIYRRAGVGDEPDHLARSLALQGQLAIARGDFALGAASLDEALGLRESIFGRSHPLVAEARADVAIVQLGLGRRDKAVHSALDAESIGRDHLRYTIRYLPERQAMAFAANRPRGLDIALSALTHEAAQPSFAVLDGVVQSRGVILDELALRTSALAGDDPQVQSLNASVATLRARYANLVLRSMEDGVPPAQLEATREAKEQAERELAERSAIARADEIRARIGLDVVRRAIPPDAALVSYVRFQRTTWIKRQGRTTRRLRPSYVAFVATRSTNEPAVVSLGSAALLESDIARLHREVHGPAAAGTTAVEAEATFRAVSSTVRQRVWDPVAKHLVGVSHVFIVPDGALNLVSFPAFSVGRNRYLIDDGPVMHLLSAERDLIREDTVPTGRGLFAVGGPSYDARPQVSVAANRLRSGCTTASSLRFEDLPGSRAEVAEISKLWRSQVGLTAGIPEVTVLSGRTATKDAVMQAAPGHRVLHLATHGFFLGGDCAPTSSTSTRGVGGLVLTPSQPTALADNPLLAAGLAFAGANQRASVQAGQDAGVLTAEEVASLDLRGIEWAVLSACDTGLGQIRAGEGVFGLRRAFQIAGVRTIIMSLWSVEDQSTRNWMHALYTERFKEGASTADAVHNASLQVLRTRRAGGQSTHPFYWAAFVAAGDWH